MEENYGYERVQNNTTESDTIRNNSICNKSSEMHVNESHFKYEEHQPKKEELWRKVLDNSQLIVTIIGKCLKVFHSSCLNLLRPTARVEFLCMNFPKCW